MIFPHSLSRKNQLPVNEFTSIFFISSCPLHHRTIQYPSVWLEPCIISGQVNLFLKLAIQKVIKESAAL